MKFGPTGISIGGVEWFAYYGIIITFGVVCAAILGAHEARRRGQSSDIVWDALIWLLIGGIIGARLWHVFTPTPSLVAEGKGTMFYLSHPLDLIMTRNGGLGIPGGVIGGLLALYLYTRRHKLNFAFWIDIAAPCIALAQAIGRWGNYVNQEVYGLPTNLPWKIHIDPLHRIAEYADKAYYHPLFLYESLWNVGNLILLLWLGRRHADRLKPGDLFLVYLIVYPVGRFLLEFLRVDAATAGGLNVNQTLMAVVAVLSTALLVWRHRKVAAADAS
jgi:phosphatidylglycerol:prolipoprotein diacylglycerol transferase